MAASEVGNPAQNPAAPLPILRFPDRAPLLPGAHAHRSRP